MTDDKQEPSVVAWLWRVKGAEGWAVAETEARHHCEVSGTLDQFDWRALSLTSDLTAMKAELEEAKKATERMWCLSCGTVTRDGQCDCTRLDMDCQNLVNYADAMAGDREAAAKEINAILARAEAAEQERDELREALSYYALEVRYNYDNDCCPESDNPGHTVAEVDLLSDDRGRRARAALSKPKPHDEGGLRSISEDGK